MVVRLLVADAQQLEDRLLHLVVVDTDGAAADLGAIEHHVVGAGQQAARVAFEGDLAAWGVKG